MPLTRGEAQELLCEWTPTAALRTHARAVELVMRAAALRYGGGAPDKGSRNSGRVANTEFESLSAQALAVSCAEGCELWKRAHQSLLKRADVVF